MSVREDREKSNSTGRGLGLAAAAIGVGVGAALYYFFNKRTDSHPNTEGSTHDWQGEEERMLINISSPISRYMAYPPSDDSFTTLSENSTTDTSIHTSDHEDGYDEDTSDDNNESQERSSINNSSSESIDLSFESDISSDINEDITYGGHSTSPNINEDVTTETGYSTTPNERSSSAGSEMSMDWDVTTSSLGVPSDQRELTSSPLDFFTNLVRLRRATGLNRQRSWSLEECSICFDVILKEQDVMSLPCTHHFHTGCIVPWLQEQQTCPNCRKTVD